MDLKTLLDTPPWDWPRDTGKILQKILSDGRAEESDRVAAAQLAGNLVVIDDEVADTLMAILRDPKESSAVRGEAALAFGAVLEQADLHGEFDDGDCMPVSPRTTRRAQELLKKLYSDESVPKDVRRRSLEASTRAPSAWHKKAIKTAYASGDREWMLTAVFAMRWVKGFDDQILRALQSGDEDMAYEAVHATGSWDIERAWPHLVVLVEDAETPKKLLVAAIGAIGQIRPENAEDVLSDLADSDDIEIAEAVAEALMESRAGEYEEDESHGKWIN